MARVLVQSVKGVPRGTSAYAAYLGFKDMGAEVICFDTEDGAPAGGRDDLVVGGMGTVRGKLRELGFPVKDICYPTSLSSFLGRKVWESTLEAVGDHPEGWPVFVKPVQGKLFTGRLVRSASDLASCGAGGPGMDVLCADPVTFVSEWRCFVMRGRILDVRHYHGDWRCHLDPDVVEAAVGAYLDAPAGYGIDFGLTDDGRTLLVEVNDGYALGSYGLEHHAYARLLSARWHELVGLEDPYDFGPLPSPIL